MVHGSTFDLPGHETNYPIARDAAASRGLDYLAIGDTHGFREVAGATVATVYPGTPEPTRFGELGAGSVAIVRIARAGAPAQVQPERVAFWKWRKEVATSLEALRRLVAEDLGGTVLDLTVDFSLSAPDLAEVEHLLSAFTTNDARAGKAGVCVLDRSRLSVAIDQVALPADMSPVIRQVRDTLLAQSVGESPEARLAHAALVELYRRITRRVLPSQEPS